MRFDLSASSPVSHSKGFYMPCTTEYFVSSLCEFEKSPWNSLIWKCYWIKKGCSIELVIIRDIQNRPIRITMIHDFPTDWSPGSDLMFPCLWLLFSLELSVSSNNQDIFQPVCIKDNRAHCAWGESLSKALPGNCSVPGQRVLRRQVLWGCLVHTLTATPRPGDKGASVSRCGALGNTWLFLVNE